MYRCAAAAKRLPSGIFARQEFALADSFLAQDLVEHGVTEQLNAVARKKHRDLVPVVDRRPGYEERERCLRGILGSAGDANKDLGHATILSHHG
jgi:hypothetical protein